MFPLYRWKWISLSFSCSSQFPTLFPFMAFVPLFFFYINILLSFPIFPWRPTTQTSEPPRSKVPHPSSSRGSSHPSSLPTAKGAPASAMAPPGGMERSLDGRSHGAASRTAPPSRSRAAALTQSASMDAQHQQQHRRTSSREEEGKQVRLLFQLLNRRLASFFFLFLVACARLYKSLCRLVGLSHFAFFAFLGDLKVGKHIFGYLVSYKQHLRLYKSPC